MTTAGFKLVGLVSTMLLAAGCTASQSGPPTPPPAPPMSQTPGAPLPAGWAWPFSPAGLASIFSNPAAVSPGILRPVDVSRVAMMQGTGPCAPVQVGPNKWITPLCGAHVQPTVPTRNTATRALENPPPGGLPAQVELRAIGLDGPVKNQQTVGVCWSFAISTTMDNALRRAKRTEVMAPLHILSSNIWDEIFTKSRSDRDLTLEASWPYDPVKACELNDGDSTCEQAYHVKPGSWRSDPNLSHEVDLANQHGVFRISKMEDIPVKPAPTDQFAAILAKGQAIYVGFDFSRQAWSNAGSGVIPDYPVADSGAGHGVALTGYRTTPSGRQFLIHNSWGADWGDHGYAWISEAMVRQHVHRAFTIEVVGPAGAALPSPGPMPSGPTAGMPFPFPLPFGVPGGAPSPGTPAPGPGASGCAAGQARDMVFGSCGPVCPNGSPHVAGLCSGGQQGAPSPSPTPGAPGVPAMPFPFPIPGGAAPSPAPSPAPQQSGCAAGQVRDLMTGQCASQCPSGVPPTNGVCF